MKIATKTLLAQGWRAFAWHENLDNRDGATRVAEGLLHNQKTLQSRSATKVAAAVHTFLFALNCNAIRMWQAMRDMILGVVAFLG